MGIARVGTSMRRAPAKAIPKLKNVGIAEVLPMVVRNNLDQTKATEKLDAVQAFQAMREGRIVHRIGTHGAVGKFHRIHDGKVEFAEKVGDDAGGHWERGKTDVASWYESTFRVVRVQVVEVDYV